MDQNPNTQNNSNQKANFQNNRGRSDSRNSGKDRRDTHEKNQNSEINRGVKAKPVDKMPGQDRIKGQDDARYTQKNREQKGVERISIDGKHQPRTKNTVPQNQTQNVPSPKQGQNISVGGGNNRYGRNVVKNSSHNEIMGKHAPIRRIETVEDIQADIERIDKDIQFEIKQIKAVKLGL